MVGSCRTQRGSSLTLGKISFRVAAIPRLEEMSDWTDWDVAHFAIGRAIGVFDRDYGEIANIAEVFYTSNPIGESLLKIADELVKVGYLEHDPDRQKYRLKRGFD